MLKRELRKEFVSKRLALSPEEIIEDSARMLDVFRNISLQGIAYLMSYYALLERKEFDPIPCEELLRLENDGLKVYWPKLESDEVTMQAVLKEKDTPLERNRFNILEPVAGEIAEPQMLDAVFVPLLAFDQKGYRVGYGKGYYDRFLSRCAQDVVRIGFSWFDAVDSIEDINQFDVPLNFCITPRRVYEF